MKIDFDKIKDLHIVCIGDIMLDEFIYGNVNRISPEAPIQILRVTKNNQMLGGVGNVAANLLELGAKVTIFSQIGKDINGDRIARLLDLYPNLEAYVYVDDSVCTTTKTRLLSGKQHMLRVDQEENKGLNKEIEEQVIQDLKEVCSVANVLIVSDYNKGFVSPAIKKTLVELPLLKILDSKGDLTPYKGMVDVITPNIKELEDYSGMRVIDFKTMSKAIDIFNSKYKINNVLVTASEKGMFFFEKIGMTQNPFENFVVHDSEKNKADHELIQKASKNWKATPLWNWYAEKSYNNNPVDVSGAGDTVMAALAIGMGLTGFEDLQNTLQFASRAAGIAISKSGTSTVTQNEMKKEYNLIQTNYRDLVPVLNRVAEQHNMGRIVGFINGTFDMFHKGHLELLRKAKEHCDYLVVALNSDDSVKRYKGPTRPVIGENDRCDIISSNKYVDDVVIFDEDDPRETLLKIKPNVMFKGMDYKDKPLIEQEVMDLIGCKLVLLVTDEITTTKIVNKLNNSIS